MNSDTAPPSWQDDPLWYKDAIIYQLHVKAFFDLNNDGIGDFRGLTRKLDYVKSLGVNTLWILPFYPSPLRDDGYDIADYRNVHPDYGSRQDLRRFVREAHRRDLKVITELVINHTSDQHPWFQAARRAPKGSAKRNFYVWNDDDQKFSETRIIFTDTESSNWAWDPVAKQYYWHRFFAHQPDLNHNNPSVVNAVTRLMRFWFDIGVDGMRLDAIPYLCVREGTNNENLPETHAVLKQMRAAMDVRYQDRMFLAEANQWPEDVREYFGEGDECHMAYHFPLMPRMYMAIAQEDRYPIIEIMRQTPDIPDNCQWAIFLRNHDELTLEMVTDKERDYMYRTYAADPRMRINVGIRRRLAPLLDNDMDKIRLMNSLLMSMPGSPIIYYGDEIGMGDNIYLGDRNGVRTPMQWSPDRNAGFSKADPQKLYLPPVMDPIYGYEAVNVEAQSRNPSSLLNWMKRLITVRKNHQAFGRGMLRFLRPGNRKILAYIREYGNDTVLCVANLARSAQPVELELGDYEGRVPLELMGRTAFPPIGELPYLLTLPGYGFYWFSLTSDVDEPTWHEQWLPPAELPVLVIFQGWGSFFPDKQSISHRRTLAQQLQQQLINEVLPEFLAHQRWFAAKGERIVRIHLNRRDLWHTEQAAWLLLQLEVELVDNAPQYYFLPVTIAWEQDSDDRSVVPGMALLAKVRRQADVGLLCDAFTDEQFCHVLVDSMGRNQEIALDGGATLRFSTTRAFAELVGTTSQALPIRRPQRESSNTVRILGDTLFLKAYRRLQPGINPELEMGHFLTEIAPFEQTAPLVGALEFIASDGTHTTLAVLQGLRSNQGDAWSWTLDYLNRYFEDSLTQPELYESIESTHSVYRLMSYTLGQRTGELHRTLAASTDNPAFDPEPITEMDLDQWLSSVEREAKQTLDKLALNLERLPQDCRVDAERLLALSHKLAPHLARLRPGEGFTALKTRYHGDYHLGQVLVNENDFIIIDFEGEPARSLEERRRKHSALRDVAGMLRSFDYAMQTALMDMQAAQPNLLEHLQPSALDWRQQASAAFLEGYQEALGDCQVYPLDATHGRQLIALFTLEKALYELRYEMDNRPEWIRVPLDGLYSILAKAP
jgi:maltose alpha-D-glucosyltransferase/alpha-amylase